MLSSALKSYHNHVYVLTTRNATERHDCILEQLGQGNFEFIFSVDKRDVTVNEMISAGTFDEIAAASFDKNAPEMSIGHICCALGHRMVYEAFLRTGAERALVFEDDVVAFDIPEDEVEAAIANIPPDAELIYWGWWFGIMLPWLRISQQLIDHFRYTLGLIRTNHKQIRNRYMRRYNKYFDVSARNYLLHSYTITRSAATKMIEMNTPIIMSSDHVPIRAIANGDLRAYAARTQLFGQRSRDPNDPLISQTSEHHND